MFLPRLSPPQEWLSWVKTVGIHAGGGGEPHEKLAERVGVQSRDFAKSNEINGFAINSCNRNDLAFANLRRRFRPLAGFCRFCQRDGTRNGTRRERRIALPRRHPLSIQSRLNSPLS